MLTPGKVKLNHNLKQEVFYQDTKKESQDARDTVQLGHNFITVTHVGNSWQ